MGISAKHIASRKSIMPGRQLVQVYERTARDGFLGPFEVMAEKRPVDRQPPDGDGIQANQTAFVFFADELKGRQIRSGWMIQHGETFWSVQGDAAEVLEQRIRVIAIEGVDPRV